MNRVRSFRIETQELKTDISILQKYHYRANGFKASKEYHYPTDIIEYIKDNSDYISIWMALAGIDKEYLKVYTYDNILVIQYRHPEETERDVLKDDFFNKNFITNKISYKSFLECFRIDSGFEIVLCQYIDGILKIEVKLPPLKKYNLVENIITY